MSKLEGLHQSVDSLLKSGDRDTQSTFLLGGVEHIIGDGECFQCWSGYPKVCECGGFLHAEFGDGSYDGDYWLHTECDCCGEPEDE